MADLAGGDWPERARKAAVGLSMSAQESDPMGTLLMDILEFFMRSGRDRIFTKELAEWLNLSEDRPWLVLKKRKEVTGQWVAQQLQGYGIRPKTLRIGEERAKGYEWADFLEAFKRYIPRGELEAFKAEIKEQAAKRDEKANPEAGKGGEPASGEAGGGGEKLAQIP